VRFEGAGGPGTGLSAVVRMSLSAVREVFIVVRQAVPGGACGTRHWLPILAGFSRAGC